MRKTRFKFSHRDNSGNYHWEATTRAPGDSRVEHITCSALWFWRTAEQPVSEPSA